MVQSLRDKQILKLPWIRGLVQEYQACGLNSILTLLHQAGFNERISAEEIKEIFDYTREGIYLQSHRFNRLNSLLRERRIPYRFYLRNYTSLLEVYRQFTLGFPVPIFFWMDILNLTRKNYTNLDYKVDFGDVFQSDNKHILLFVGYDEKGELLYFIDPSYQLPFIPKTQRDISKYYFTMTKLDYYHATKQLKDLIMIVFSRTDAKKYKQEEKEKRKGVVQEKLPK